MLERLYCRALTELTDHKDDNKSFFIKKKKKDIYKFFSLEYLRWNRTFGGLPGWSTGTNLCSDFQGIPSMGRFFLFFHP